ncbi:MAG: DUF4402 domain-containing protein [Pseudomonadota bacterium]
MESVADLNFGRLVTNGNAGTVFIDPNDASRTASAGITLAGGTPSAGRFIGVGDPRRFVIIFRGTLPVLTRVGGDETLTINALYPDASWGRIGNLTFKRIPDDGIVALDVGAELEIPENATPGIYQGEYEVIINYL